MTVLANGFYDVPPGKVATIVTHLEMRERPKENAPIWPEGVSLRRVEPTLDWYRAMFRKVGTDWLWFGRLRLTDAALQAIITHSAVEIFTLTRDGRDLALLELDFRAKDACELAYFGLAAPLIGTGAGRALMRFATETAWARAIERFHVHTCTLDSPRALEFYRRSGFEVLRQQVEIADDPRLMGLHPRHAGAHVPLIEG